MKLLKKVIQTEFPDLEIVSALGNIVMISQENYNGNDTKEVLVIGIDEIDNLIKGLKEAKAMINN